MFKDMIEYYTPLLTSIRTMLGFKSNSLFGASIASAISIEAIRNFLHQPFLGVSVGVLSMVALFIIIDWLIGSAASNKLAAIAKKENNKENFEKYRLKSSKITFTIFKFISLYLWLVLAHSVHRVALRADFMPEILNIISIIPILLFGFREYISIGEGIEILFGKKPYLFILGEKIFDIFQFKFLSRLKGKE